MPAKSAKMTDFPGKNPQNPSVSKKDSVIDSLNVWLGKKNKVDVVTSEDLYLKIPKRKKKKIRAIIEY